MFLYNLRVIVAVLGTFFTMPENPKFAGEGGRLKECRNNSSKKTFKCDPCGKLLNYAVSLKRHKLLHTGEKAFRCKQCDKCFYQAVNLHEHERIHTYVRSAASVLFIYEVSGDTYELTQGRSHLNVISAASVFLIGQV